MWPKLSSHDRHLTLPFAKDSGNLSDHDLHATVKDFIFFDAGMVVFDLDWDLFEKQVESLFEPNSFDRDKFFTALSETRLIAQWERGLLGPHEYAKGFEECLCRAQKAPGSLKTQLLHLYEIKKISRSIIGAPRSSVLDISKKLRENHYFTGILSNATPWHEADLLEKAEIRNNFDLVLFSQDLGCAKPENEIYQLAEKLAIKVISAKMQVPESTLQFRFHFIDDTPANVRAALARGWQARLVDTLKDESLWNSPDLGTLSQKKQNLIFGSEAALRIEKLLSCFLTNA